MMSSRCAAGRRTERRRWWVPPVAAALLLPACGGLGEAMTAHTSVVARAAGKELRVDDAAQMLAANPELPPDPQIVRALADLWVDYTLLGHAVVQDTTLAALDLEGLIGPAREQLLVMKLREEVVQVDTLITDDELARRWATEGPGVEIRARHILLRTPTEGAPAQRDSVRQRAEDLRQEAIAGADFAMLAQEHSQDPGSAARGGDLGFFSRGRMVQPFDEAAFELQVGEISPVVETPFGFHVIRVEERRQPELGEEREDFRSFLVQMAIEEAETSYLESLEAEAEVQVRAGAVPVVREISSRPEMTLRGRAAERPIASFRGGQFTAAEFAEFIRRQTPQMQNAFATATDDQLESAVLQLVQNKLLLEEAASRGMTVSEEEEQQLRRDARQMIRELTEATGFAEAARARADATALDAHVRALLEGVLTGQQPYIPLGNLGLALRATHAHEINEGSFGQVVNRLEEIRAQQPAPPPAMPEELQQPLPGEAPPGGPDAAVPGVSPALPEPGSP